MSWFVHYIWVAFSTKWHSKQHIAVRNTASALVASIWLRVCMKFRCTTCYLLGGKVRIFQYQRKLLKFLLCILSISHVQAEYQTEEITQNEAWKELSNHCRRGQRYPPATQSGLQKDNKVEKSESCLITLTLILYTLRQEFQLFSSMSATHQAETEKYKKQM